MKLHNSFKRLICALIFQDRLAISVTVKEEVKKETTRRRIQKMRGRCTPNLPLNSLTIPDNNVKKDVLTFSRCVYITCMSISDTIYVMSIYMINIFVFISNYVTKNREYIGYLKYFSFTNFKRHIRDMPRRLFQHMLNIFKMNTKERKIQQYNSLRKNNALDYFFKRDNLY